MPRVPRLLSGPNVKSLNLSPPEAYLLSRVDDLLDEHDLALVTGMTPAQVGAALERLASLGALELDEGPPSRAAPSLAGSSPGVAGPPPRSALQFDGPPPYDLAELDEPIELEIERKRRVLDAYYRLDDLTYYELLAVPGDADKKQIKTAYYAVAPEFHPDKYFRKQLGSYKTKIEAVFARITLAHDVLTSPKQRAEYDEYLDQTHKNRTTSAMLDQTARDVAAILAAVEQAAAQAVAAQARPSPAQPPPPPIVALSPQEVLRQRREALARKLTGVGGRRPGPAAPAPVSLRAHAAPAEMDPIFAERAAEALRVRHEAAVAEAKQGQILRYMEGGRTALEAQDFASAANSYRIASSLAPDDPAVQAACNEALQRVAVALADGYWKQALYEEGQDRWGEAALSYSKVCAGRPDNAKAHERVAFATLKSSNNARRAVEFARKAIELEPRRPDYHVTLARAYAAAGLEKSASSELDRALELAPKEPKVQTLVAQARAAISAPPPEPKAPAPQAKANAPPPEKEKPGGFLGFVHAVRSAITPKDGK